MRGSNKLLFQAMMFWNCLLIIQVTNSPHQKNEALALKACLREGAKERRGTPEEVGHKEQSINGR